ncbi:hypothetical protein AMS68_004225 [Peltaster fructicola]|uniref:DH domain-containing protein n=1 Tax=Peltaster fructicola TaxID=286661 RepID=A0A6H0XVS1_9PEZI|nr:hypothetical protein AMS68_004225 [Peltaster fructicola]
MTPHNGNDVAPTDNIMNSVADASSSLFQICVSLRQRLLGVPGFSDFLLEEEEYADQDTDPVTVLWRTFRRGFPLMLLYNTLCPDQPLVLNDKIKEERKGKDATFKFVQACIHNLKFPNEECFILTDLYNDDTTGFVKVARVVNRVLDLLVAQGVIQDVRPTASDFTNADRSLKRTQRQHIVAELVTTERTYVQHLELLQSFKNLVEERGIIPGDAVHDIFLNLNSLLDFQRRFLIRVEQTNAMPEEEQNWGRPFQVYADAFKVYEPYIANQKKCERIVVEQFSKLKDAGGSVEMRQMVESSTSLYGFLMKPFQRLSKYPLLLDDLYKKGDLDEERKADLLEGKKAATEVLTRTNRAVDREEKAEAVQELKGRVEDWKGHRVEAFGELLLYGTFTVLKSENISSGKDAERQDIDLSKPKNKLASKQLVDKKGKPKMQLKGRIFMQNVTDIVVAGKTGSYTCQIFWKGDPSIENFVIRFPTEDMMRRWSQQLEAQRRKYKEREMTLETYRSNGTSETQFEFMRNQPPIENPYAHLAGEDDDDDDSEGYSNAPSWNSQHYQSRDESQQDRNASQTSLRSRSTTGDSNGPPTYNRAMPPRMPPGSIGHPGHGPLSIRTQMQAPMTSPGDRAGESYFSPGGDSPLSSIRTSSSSNIYPFPRQQYSQNGYYNDDPPQTHARFTAPAMGRPMLGRETSAPPVCSGHAAPRHRSASSPDINQNPRAAKRVGTQPPVPDMPAPYQGYNAPAHMIPRSQSGSPALPPGMPPRGSSSSPNSQRERSYSIRRDDPNSNFPYEGRAAAAATSAFPMPPPSRGATPVQPSQRAYAPPMNTAPSYAAALPAPTQLKVKVHCQSANQVLTLVVPLNISYQSLKDRVDAKLQRSTNLTLGGGQNGMNRDNVVKLKYLDDNDFVTIQTDDDVQEAFESWREQSQGSDSVPGMGEVELFCQR